MFAVCVIAFLCLVPVSHAAPADCDNLVRPLDQVDLNHLKGRWVMVAASIVDPEHLKRSKGRDTVTINFANSSETSTIAVTRIFGFPGGSCQYMYANITLEGSGYSFKEYNLTVTLLHTSCPDCLVMRFDHDTKKLMTVYLFSRRRAVDQKEMEELGAQTECLNMPPPVLEDPTKELCPEQISTDTEGQTA